MRIILIVILAAGLSACRQTTDDSKPRAAIIDQLYMLSPNPVFIGGVTRTLEGAGFEVDLYQGKDITVDFYRRLPKRGYRLILFRAHSGILGVRSGSEIALTEGTWLFTSEPYNQLKYPKEQLTRQMGMARIDQTQPWVFAVGAEFIKRSMEVRFPGTAIIMMGCSTLNLTDLASAFVDRGASVYLGWDATVDLGYVDGTTLTLMERLVTEGLTIHEATTATIAEEGKDPTWGATLKHYPAATGDRVLQELTGASNSRP